MKIKIFTEGGEKIGWGHVSRCLSIYEEAKIIGEEVEFIINGDVEEVSFLKNKNITNENWVEKKNLTLEKCKDSYCVVDSYIASKEILSELSNVSKNIVFIDDNNRIDYKRGLVVNPSLSIEGLNYPKKTEIEYLWGKDYIILRKAFIDLERKDIRKQVENVIIVMGGSDIKKILPIIISGICNNYRKIKFNVVVGTSSNLIELKKISHSNVEFYSNIDENNMKDLMLNSDVAITAAGQTIYELLATQTPFIPIKIAENQSNNLKSLQKMKLIDSWLTFDSERFMIELNNKFFEILNYKKRKERILKYKGLIDGYGAKRIIQKLIQSKKEELYFRKVQISDCDLIYNWANDYKVRINAFNSDKIDYENHKRWFEYKLKDFNSVIYIILNKSIPIGQIRIDIENNIGKIDYSIDEKYRGKGYGTLALKLIGSKIKEDFPNVKKIIGQVKYNNISSQNAFEKSKFDKKEREDYIEYEKRIESLY